MYKGRVTEKSLERFLRQHSEEYQLSRVDETCFKGMLFSSFGRPGGGTQDSGRRGLGFRATTFLADWREQPQKPKLTHDFSKKTGITTGGGESECPERRLGQIALGNIDQR